MFWWVISCQRKNIFFAWLFNLLPSWSLFALKGHFSDDDFDDNDDDDDDSNDDDDNNDDDKVGDDDNDNDDSDGDDDNDDDDDDADDDDDDADDDDDDADDDFGVPLSSAKNGTTIENVGGKQKHDDCSKNSFLINPPWQHKSWKSGLIVYK